MQNAAPNRLPEVERLERSLLGHMGRAIWDWKLIEDGDRIMVGLSGGKDSWSLLHLLRLMQRKAPVDFSLVAVNLDQGQPGFPADRIEGYLREQGYDYRMLRENTYKVVLDKVPEGKTYCSLCSRLRRGILYNAAVDLGCNKIALGHHRDDLVETLLLNLFFSGQTKSMAPVLRSDDGRNTVIRPLAYAPEEELAEYARLVGFPVIPCNVCGSQENAQRARIKRLLADLSQEHPSLKSNVLAALGNVKPTHLLDPRVRKVDEEEERLRRTGALLPIVAGDEE